MNDTKSSEEVHAEKIAKFIEAVIAGVLWVGLAFFGMFAYLLVLVTRSVKKR